MLSNNLTTNEVKDATGTSVPFTRIDQQGRTAVFQKVGCSPHAPHRVTISHQEIGTGTKRRMRSVCRVDLSQTGDVDQTTSKKTSAYVVLDNPVGNSSDNNTAIECLANLGSLVFTLATSTFKYDGTGNGCVSLLNGEL